MTVSKECESEILRLVQAEKWRQGTVAAELGVHHDVVTRVLAQDATGQPAREPRPSKLDAYKGFIVEPLERYPRLRATRLRTMIAERGFRGSAKLVERFVKGIRPRAANKAYLVCERLPGEQGQVDWGHVGQLAVMGGTRALWVFVMLLAYSRMRYAELVLDMTAESLRRSILRALSFFGGVPRQLPLRQPQDRRDRAPWSRGATSLRDHRARRTASRQTSARARADARRQGRGRKSHTRAQRRILRGC
jgi:transposase